MNFKIVLSLLLIDKVSSFRNSYSLTKVLSRKFDIIDFVNVIEELTSKGLITVNVVNGISNYEITKSGKDYLDEYQPSCKDLLLSKYLSEREFINSLIS